MWYGGLPGVGRVLRVAVVWDQKIPAAQNQNINQKNERTITISCIIYYDVNLYCLSFSIKIPEFRISNILKLHYFPIDDNLNLSVTKN